MADIPQLFIGRLTYVEPLPALDDVRFERIVRGFAKHYDVTTLDGSRFTFARGEGYLRIGAGDAFGYVDSGIVERLRDRVQPADVAGDNVVAMPPRYNGLKLSFNFRVLLVYWAVSLIAGWLFFGGDWPYWLVGFIAATAASAALVRRSLRAKLAVWLARETWN